MLQKVKSFFWPTKKQTVCQKPLKPLPAKTSFCKVCFKPIEEATFHFLLNKNVSICQRCFNELKPKFERFKLDGISGLSIYHYDENIRSKLYQLKGCGDVELAPVFLEYFQTYLILKFRGYFLVCAPSAKSGDEERGFNHVQEIFKFLPNKRLNCIKKISDIKQADLSSKDRQKIGNYLAFDNSFSVSGKNILLLDDVMTTGSTLKAMISIMKTHGAKKIKVLVMAHTQKDKALVPK